MYTIYPPACVFISAELSMTQAQANKPSLPLKKQPSKSRAKELGVVALSMLSIGSGGEQQSVHALERAPAPIVSTIDLTNESIQTPHSNVSIPEGCTRILPTEEYRTWENYQENLIENTLSNREGLKVYDASRFMSPQTQTALSRYVGLRSSQRNMQIVRVEENGYKFAIKNADELWYLSEALHFKHVTSNGVSFSKTRLVMWKKGEAGEVSLEFKVSGTFGYNSQRRRSVNFSRLSQTMNAAESNRESEERDISAADTLRVGNEVTGYIGMIDGNRNDSVIWNMRDDIRYFPQIMNARLDENGDFRHNYVVRNGSEFIEVRSNPYQKLKQHVAGMYAKGIRNFHLNLAGHGSESGITLNSSGRGGRLLSPQQLRELFNQYSDCQFLVDSCACGGGGLANMLKDYRDPTGETGRVVVKLQAKPLTWAQSAHIDGLEDSRGVPMGHSSYYYLFWNHFLKQGEDFGDAHVLADKYCQMLCGCDAEIWKSGPNGGLCTR